MMIRRILKHGKPCVASMVIQTSYMSQIQNYVRIVYDVGAKKPKIWKIKGTDLLNDGNVEVKPILYKVALKTK